MTEKEMREREKRKRRRKVDANKVKMSTGMGAGKPQRRQSVTQEMFCIKNKVSGNNGKLGGLNEKRFGVGVGGGGK